MGNEARHILRGGNPGPIRHGEPSAVPLRPLATPTTFGTTVPLRRDDEPARRTSTDWLSRLPPRVRPQLLVAQRPAVGDELAACWDEPAQCWRYLADLIEKHRPGSDFQPWYLVELYSLRSYYAELHPGLDRVRFLKR